MNVDHLTAIVYTQMVIHSALFVCLGKDQTAKITVTITNPLMKIGKVSWNPEEFPVDYLDEESLRESARNMVSPQTETSYASIIEIALDLLLE